MSYKEGMLNVSEPADVPLRKGGLGMKMRASAVGHLQWIFLVLLVTALLAGCGPEMTPAVADTQSAPEAAGLSPITGAPAFQSPLPTPTLPSRPGRPPGAPPFCAFPGGAPPDANAPSRLDAFVFSEPQVVLTSTIGIEIAEWLPNSQRLLIVRGASIETFDAVTGSRQQYAQLQSAPGWPPFWLSESEAVAYRDWEFTDKERGKARWDLWVSTGPSAQAQRAVQGLFEFGISVAPDGSLLRFSRTPQQLLPLPATVRRFFHEMVIPIDLTDLLYPKYGIPIPEGYRPREFQVTRRPDGSQLALYANPYLYLVNVNTQFICEVDLGRGREGLPRFPLAAQWSPNGRYLAMITTAQFPGDLVRFSEVTVLDTVIGDQRQLPLEGDAQEIDWAPDSRHLLVLSMLDKSQWRPVQKLFVADTWTDKSREVSPEHIFGGGTGFNLQMAWSPDGRKVAVKCPLWPEGQAIAEDRICLITVEIQP